MLTGHSVIQYYLCPQKYFTFARDTGPSACCYFALGPDTTCYGHLTLSSKAGKSSHALRDALPEASVSNGSIQLPFAPDEIIQNLQRENYADQREVQSFLLLSQLYYWLRPFLHIPLRSRIQQFHFHRRDELSFPRWPIDSSVDNIFEHLMLLALRANPGKRIPFIWFWPAGKSSCAILTHDVESIDGKDFCDALMDLDDSYGFKSSFQIIPEERYPVSETFLDSIRNRGFEIAVHDLNHDGRLYRSRAGFLHRAAKINAYLRQFQTDGFRSGALYRKQSWYDSLNCAYDMSVPNSARFDPQGGGCCTVMPYFVGDVLEIPVTTVQDYTLFHILKDYSLDIWKQQTQAIIEKHGLMSFIIHPDYILTPRALHTYRSLLDYLTNLRKDSGVWATTPREVNRWWRQRNAMCLIEVEGQWKIIGDGSDRASLAYATEVDGKVLFTLAEPPTHGAFHEHNVNPSFPHSAAPA